MNPHKLRAVLCVLMAAACVSTWAQPVQQGAGSYVLAPKGSDRAVPKAPYRTEAMQRTAAQTNTWYSALLFNPQPEVLFVQPLTVQATAKGFELALPSKQVVPTERKDVEIHYPHTHPLLIAPVAFAPGKAKLARASDWDIDIDMGSGADQMLVTVAHGSPYAYIKLSRGDVRITLPTAGERFATQGDARMLALRVQGKSYALFGPTGVRWEQASPTEWIGHLPQGKGYVSAAALPDDTPETLALLARHAYAFLQNTRVDWQFDPATSQVRTHFKATTEAMEGPNVGPLLGLYPHHWFNNPAVEGKLGPAYDTVRGKIRLLPAAEFETRLTYTGFVPYWPGVQASPRSETLKDLLKTDLRNARRMMLEIGQGPYWQGKGLQRITKLMDVAEQQGDLAARDQLLKLTQSRIEDWFKGDSKKTYFHYDKALGTVVGYPEEFFSVEQLNDHHFHYGYWIRAVADIALRDPAWASKERWGGMVDLLIADIATDKRGGADFPFLRNFDMYEGHSWASGIGLGASGNNQESSSEAVNAWAGLVLWGEITGNRALRDLGLYLYTSEIDAIGHYWFDQHGQVFAPEYKSAEASMVFGGKYAHNTWWTDDPRQTKGINLLPITTVSNYLGHDPAYVQRSLATLPAEQAIWAARGKKVDPPDIWQDIFAQYQGLVDPAAGLARWDRWGAVELGNTRSYALHSLLALQEMGTPDASVTADTTLYSVFKRPDGGKTYLAFNAGKTPLTVRFSDGKTLEVPPGTLGRTP